MDARLRALTRELARAHDAEPGPDLRAQRARFLQHALAAQASRPAKPRRQALACLAVASVIALAFASRGLWSRSSPAPLAFEVSGVTGTVGAWIAAPVERALPLRFADGSGLTLARGSRARVVSTSARGAQIVLEQGQVSVHVVHREHTDFRFRAGPFEVRVVGTRFDLAWDARHERFALTLREGAVLVSGPELSGPKLVSGGERLELEVNRAHELPIRRGAPDPALAPQQNTPRAPGATQIVASDARRAAAVRRAASLQGGPQGLIRRADSARFSAQPQQAVELLLALRERFLNAPEARDSAFLLGRLYADQLASAGAAERWFKQYLRERPAGAFAREARGRLIELQLRHADGSSARGDAEEYLRRYPEGPHAPLARAVLAGTAVAP